MSVVKSKRGQSKVEFDALTEESFGKLLASNEWNMAQTMVLGDFIVEEDAPAEAAAPAEASKEKKTRKKSPPWRFPRRGLVSRVPRDQGITCLSASYSSCPFQSQDLHS